MEDDNRVTLTGVLTDQPVYRETPLGREIAEMAVRVDRKSGKWERIMCIAWGSMARKMGCAEPDSLVHLTGRMQSRGYTKILPDGTAKAMMTWEVSAGCVELLTGGKGYEEMADQGARDDRLESAGAAGDMQAV